LFQNWSLLSYVSAWLTVCSALKCQTCFSPRKSLTVFKSENIFELQPFSHYQAQGDIETVSASQESYLIHIKVGNSTLPCHFFIGILFRILSICTFFFFFVCTYVFPQQKILLLGSSGDVRRGERESCT